MKTWNTQILISQIISKTVVANTKEEAQAIALSQVGVGDMDYPWIEVYNIEQEGEDEMENQIVTVTGHWTDDPSNNYTVAVSLGEWNGVEDETDRGIFYYTDGQPLKVGDIIASDFVVTAIGE